MTATSPAARDATPRPPRPATNPIAVAVASAAVIYAPPRPCPPRAPAGVCFAMRLIDSLGRRPLLLAGSVCTAGSLMLTALALHIGSPGLTLAGLVAFVGFYALSLAPIFFVLLHECFTEAAAPLASGLFTSL